MPRSSRRAADEPAASSRSEVQKTQAIGAFLRNLAARADADAALAREIEMALIESGLLPTSDRLRPPPKEPPKSPAAPIDPFRVLRDEGDESLYNCLQSLELPELRAVVRRHRLDPARISARWRDRERVIQLIVSQVKAQASYGKAFSHV